MEVMEVYNEAMATWIITRVTSGNCEGAEFVFGLIESAIRKEATEILLTPVQELDMVLMDFGRLHCYYRQPEITRAQFAYLAIYLVLIGNVAAEEARTERLFRGSDERLYNVQFGKTRLPDRRHLHRTGMPNQRKCCNFAVAPVVGWPDAPPGIFGLWSISSGDNLNRR